MPTSRIILIVIALIFAVALVLPILMSVSGRAGSSGGLPDAAHHLDSSDLTHIREKLGAEADRLPDPRRFTVRVVDADNNPVPEAKFHFRTTYSDIAALAGQERRTARVADENGELHVTLLFPVEARVVKPGFEEGKIAYCLPELPGSPEARHVAAELETVVLEKAS